MTPSEDEELIILDQLQSYMDNFYDCTAVSEGDDINMCLEPIVGLLLKELAGRIGVATTDLIAHVFIDDFGRKNCKYHTAEGKVVTIKSNEDFLNFWREHRA